MSTDTKSFDALGQIIESQKSLQKIWVDFDKLKTDEAYMQHWVLDQIGHVIEESIELRKELPARKHWKKQSQPLDFTKIRDEYSDLLHFVVNVGLFIGLETSEDFLNVYNGKHKIVLERQENGY